MERIGLYTGSFDPVTLGHVDIMARALVLVDRLIIAVGKSATKATLLSPDMRCDLLAKVVEEELRTDKIEISLFNHLTVDFAKEKGATILIRGLRNISDLDFEGAIANMNHAMSKDIETVFLLARPEHMFISSTLVKQIHQMKGDITAFVPNCVLGALK